VSFVSLGELASAVVVAGAVATTIRFLYWRIQSWRDRRAAPARRRVAALNEVIATVQGAATSESPRAPKSAIPAEA
jgi:hypothetical protein